MANSRQRGPIEVLRDAVEGTYVERLDWEIEAFLALGLQQAQHFENALFWFLLSRVQ